MQGACDCHIHINDPRFPYLPEAELQPPPATVADYRAVQAALGLQRVVVVQPSSYGTDNRCTLDAVATLGADRARAIVVVRADEDAHVLFEMHAQGARGVRLNLVRGATLDIDGLPTLAHRLADLGWHLQLHMHADILVGLESVLMRLPLPIVFDHLARIGPGQGVSHPVWATVRRLLDKGNTWIKLSGPYLDSQSGAPASMDQLDTVRALVALAPERMVWGSDWPHPSLSAARRPIPDARQLFALLDDWVPEPALRERILVDNPQTLYGFEPVHTNQNS